MVQQLLQNTYQPPLTPKKVILMKNAFIKKINEYVPEPLTLEECEIIEENITVRKLRKKQSFLQEGDVCKNIAYIKKGLLKQFSVDEKGNEHIIQLATEGWMIGDLYSFITEKPAMYNIEAVEETELLIISKLAESNIIKKVAKYETFVRAQITGAYLVLQQRLNSMTSLAPEERYIWYISLYPTIVQRVPQYMIASYLGLRAETISRIRKKMFIQNKT